MGRGGRWKRLNMLEGRKEPKKKGEGRAGQKGKREDKGLGYKLIEGQERERETQKFERASRSTVLG